MGSTQHIQSSDIVYDAALLFWRMVTNVFFREVRPRGAFNIPREGPVIFVAAPHNNQVCSPAVFCVRPSEGVDIPLI